MERLQTGLGGLAMVLLVMFAASLFAGVARGPEPAEPSAETLAMLGAAPATVDPARPDQPRRRHAAGAQQPRPDLTTI